MSQFKPRGRNGYVSFMCQILADNAIMHRSLAICMTTKEMSTILLGNEGDSDSGLSCVHCVGPHL